MFRNKLDKTKLEKIKNLTGIRMTRSAKNVNSNRKL